MIGRIAPPGRLGPPDPRGQVYYGPSLHPSVLHALGQALIQASHAPLNAAHWLRNQEYQDNRHWALQESLNELAGRKHSSQWAWEMENPHGPFQRDRARHLIHPLGG
jgi:hypothetical protein